MIALPAQRQQRQGLVPCSVGCFFPHGRGGRNLRIYLITDDAASASRCGQRLKDWGLPPEPSQLVILPKFTAYVQNYWVPKQFEPLLGVVEFPVIRFGKYPLVLDTNDPEELVAFSRWAVEHFNRERERKHAQRMKNPSLEDLANAGEIETID